MPRPRADSVQPESAFQHNREQIRNAIIALQNRFSRQFQTSMPNSTSGTETKQQQGVNDTRTVAQADSDQQKSTTSQLSSAHVPLIFTAMNQLHLQRPAMTHEQVKALAVDLSGYRTRVPVTTPQLSSGHAPLIFTVMDQLHMKHPSVTHDHFKALAVEFSSVPGRVRSPLLLIATAGLGFGLGYYTSRREGDPSLP